MNLMPLDSIPPLPYVAHEIMLAVNADDANMAEISATLEREPGLTARLVSLANAAFFAGQRPVYSTEDAALRLGLNRVRVVAASLLLSQQFDPRRCPAFRPADYWMNAVGTAFAVGRLAPHLESDSDADAAYLAGLLHNLGLLLLAHVFPRDMDSVLREYADADQGRRSLAAITRQVIGADHHSAGRLLLTEWGLPEEIAEVAGAMGDLRPKGRAAALTDAVQYCAQWTRHRFADLPERAAPAGATADRLERIGELCRRETDQLESFANLLAAG